MARRHLTLALGLVMALQGFALPWATPARPAGPGGQLVSPAPRWQWPLEPAPAVLRRFQSPPTPWSAGHRGVDLMARVGEPVLAAGDGVVSFSGTVAGRGVVAVQHPGGLRTTYEPLRARAPVGTTVTAGQPIGELDVTPGHCAPVACLHWGLLRGVGRSVTYLDPLLLRGIAAGPSVLLPLSPGR